MDGLNKSYYFLIIVCALKFTVQIRIARWEDGCQYYNMDRIRDGNLDFLLVYLSYLYFPNFMGKCRITFL